MVHGINNNGLTTIDECLEFRRFDRSCASYRHRCITLDWSAEGSVVRYSEVSEFVRVIAQTGQPQTVLIVPKLLRIGEALVVLVPRSAHRIEGPGANKFGESTPRCAH